MAFPIRTNAYCDIEVFVRDSDYTIKLGVGTAYPFVTNVAVSRTLNIIDSASISFDAPFEEGLAMLNSELFLVNNVVKFRMGYRGSADDDGPDLYGIITDGGKGMTLSPEGLTGSINIQGCSANSWARTTVATKKGDNLHDIVVKFAKTSGFETKVDDTAKSRLEGNIDYKMNGQVVFLEWIKKVLPENGCSWTVSEVTEGKRKKKKTRKTLSITTVKAIMDGPVSWKFIMRGGFLEKANEYPIIAFAPEVVGALWKGGYSPTAGGAKVADVDGDGKITVDDATKDDVKLKQTGGKAKGGGVLDIDTITDDIVASLKLIVGQVWDMVSPSDPENPDPIYRKAKAIATVGRSLIAYSGNLTTIGIPSFPPGALVEVSGCGDLFDGIFGCNTVSHTWTGAGIETNLVIHNRTAKTAGGTTPSSADTSPQGTARRPPI